MGGDIEAASEMDVVPLAEGMTQFEFGAQVRAVFRALGSSGSAWLGLCQ